MKKEFEKIYSQNGWMFGQKESGSGDGSTLEFTVNLRKELPIIFEKYNIKTVFDGACGDYNWMKEVVKETDITYIGGDIVGPVMKECNKKYGSDKVSFLEMDMTTDPLPDVDLMICRQVLFHLSYRSLNDFFQNFSRSNIKYILTTTHVNKGKFVNKDISNSSFRYIDLFKPPFNISKNDVLESVKDYIEPYYPRTMILLEKDSLPKAI